MELEEGFIRCTWCDDRTYYIKTHRGMRAMIINFNLVPMKDTPNQVGYECRECGRNNDVTFYIYNVFPANMASDIIDKVCEAKENQEEQEVKK